MDSIRKRLKTGETLIGSWINSGSPAIAELMSTTGFDFLCIALGGGLAAGAADVSGHAFWKSKLPRCHPASWR